MKVRKFAYWVAGLVLVCSGLLISGCKTGSSQTFSDLHGTTAAEATNAAAAPVPISGTDMFRPGESMTITFTDLPDVKPPMTLQVREDGTITLLENQTFVVTNKMRGSLEQEIRAR